MRRRIIGTGVPGAPSTLGAKNKKPPERNIRIRTTSEIYSYDFVDIRCDVSHKRLRAGFEVQYSYGIVARLEKHSEKVFCFSMWSIEKGTDKYQQISDSDISAGSIPEHIPEKQCFGWLKKTLCQEQQFLDRIIKPYANSRAISAEYYQQGKELEMNENNLQIENFKYKVTNYSDIMGGWVDENPKED